MPGLSTFNGPSYLLHAMEVLGALGVPEKNVRFLPAIDHFAGPEILAYRGRLIEHEATPGEFDPREAAVRLAVNVRDDNRLAWLLPFLAVGMPGRRLGEAEGSAAEGGAASLAERTRAWVLQRFGTLREAEPEWTNRPPVERLVEQLCECFPELLEGAHPDDPPTGFIRAGSFEADYRDGPQGEVNVSGDSAGAHVTYHDPFAERGFPEELLEILFTKLFTAIACGDMLCGFDFDHRVEPEGRDIPVTIGAQSRIDDLAAWVRTYPHYPPLPFGEQDLPEADRKDWDAYLRGGPEQAPAYVTDETRWTAQDPALEAMYEELREGYRAGRTEDMTAWELLLLATRHLPDFVPHYPHQSSVTGGLNLGGIALRLVHRWIDGGHFMGMTREDLDRFDPVQQVVLCGLLIQRRSVFDYGGLFTSAVRLLVHPEIDVQFEAFVPQSTALGTPFSQPGKTMALGGACAFHSPEAVVHVPLDRTSGEEADAMEAKLDTVRRLFLPAHVPTRFQWGVGWVDLHPPVFPLDPKAETEAFWGDTAGLITSRPEWVPAEETVEEKLP